MDEKHPCPVRDINLIFSLSAAPVGQQNFFALEIASVQNDLELARDSVFHTDQPVRLAALDIRVDKKGLSFRVFNPAVVLGSTLAEIPLPIRALPKDAFESYRTMVQNPSQMPNYEVMRAQLHSKMVRSVYEKVREKELELDQTRNMHYAVRKVISLWFDAFVRPEAP